jgi:predicted nucleic acid-binding protein
LNALIDSDVLLDFLDGYTPAAQEIGRYRECCISIISWMEILAGARSEADEDIRRGFLAHFRVVPLTPLVAEEAVALRRKHRIKLPDAIIWASAISENCLLVSRNTKDFPAGQAGVRFPYRR